MAPIGHGVRLQLDGADDAAGVAGDPQERPALGQRLCLRVPPRGRGVLVEGVQEAQGGAAGDGIGQQGGQFRQGVGEFGRRQLNDQGRRGLVEITHAGEAYSDTLDVRGAGLFS